MTMPRQLMAYDNTIGSVNIKSTMLLLIVQPINIVTTILVHTRCNV